MLRSTLFMTLAGLAAAQYKFNAVKNPLAPPKSLAPIGSSSPSWNLAASFSTCDNGEVACDSGCMESTGTCCGVGDGSYCEQGYYCVSNGCCENGSICSGEPSGCAADQDQCGDFCIPSGKVCCEAGGGYCDQGETCTSDGYCSPGGSGGGGGGGSSNGCDSTEEDCGSLCMPKGQVCCNNSGYYCLAGQVCEDDFTCSYGTSYSVSFFTTPSPTTPVFSFSTASLSFSTEDTTEPTTTQGSSAFPTGLRSGGDGGDGGDNSSTSKGAAPTLVPGAVAGLLALVPLVL